MAVQDYPWNYTLADKCNCYAYVEKHGLRRLMAKRSLRKQALQPGQENCSVKEVVSPELVDLLEHYMTSDGSLYSDLNY